ncbi:MAG TPA: hypothetical protein VHP11_05565, partial [Tepidisphaeraceae bacterium]|nr:hypothetical protein [Tepidisphaeraceae bacterium]
MRQASKALAAAVMGVSWAFPAWGGVDITYNTIALTGQQAAGMGEGITYRLFDYAVIGSSGEVAYRGMVNGAGVPEGMVLWAGMPGSAQTVLQPGPVSEWGDGVMSLGADSYPVMNSQGQLAVKAVVKG